MKYAYRFNSANCCLKRISQLHGRIISSPTEMVTAPRRDTRPRVSDTEMVTAPRRDTRPRVSDTEMVTDTPEGHPSPGARYGDGNGHPVGTPVPGCPIRRW